MRESDEPVYRGTSAYTDGGDEQTSRGERAYDIYSRLLKGTYYFYRNAN
jgi:hypothetical protein